MKKILIILIALSNYALGQGNSINQQAPKLLEFNNVIDITSMMDKTYWSLGVHYQTPGNTPVKPEVVIASIDSFASSNESDHEGERFYIKKYRKSVDSIFNDMTLIGSTLGQFVYMSKSDVPIRICTYNDTSKIFFITGITLQDVYNTLRLTSRQRAAKVITTYLIPSLKSMKPIMNKDFNYIGLGAVYASKDFSSNSSLATEAEYILFVVPSKKANEFIKGKITEDELVESADIISSDRDMVTGTKKIKIVLE